MRLVYWNQKATGKKVYGEKDEDSMVELEMGEERRIRKKMRAERSSVDVNK